MDGYQFDAFTRRIATPTSRRQALRLGGGGLAAALLTLAGLREAAADDTPKPLGKKCQKDEQCESGYCAPDTATCAVATPPGIIVTGELTAADPIFPGPIFPHACLVGYHYDAYMFEHPGGPLSLAVRGLWSDGGTLPDAWVALHTGGVPSDFCGASSIADDNNSGCGFDAYLETTQPAGTYTAVVVEFTNTPGTYTLDINTFSGYEACPPPP